MELEITRVGKHVALWRLNRPKDNSFGGTLLRELIDASRAARDDDDIRAVVTTGAGRSFAVGADLAKLAQLDGASLNATFHRGLGADEHGFDSPSSHVEALEELGIGHWALEWLKLDKPLIAAINGPAAGGGFCFALLHDLRVMGPAAFLTPGFTSLGLAPELGTSWLLPRLVGQSRATEILLLNPRLDAESCLRYGLANRVADDPVEEALGLAEALAALPPRAVAATLRLTRGAAGASLDDQLAREYRFQQRLWETEDFRTAAVDLVARFARRTPAPPQ